MNKNRNDILFYMKNKTEDYGIESVGKYGFLDFLLPFQGYIDII